MLNICLRILKIVLICLCSFIGYAINLHPELLFNLNTLSKSEASNQGEIKKRFHALALLIKNNNKQQAPLAKLTALNDFFNQFAFIPDTTYQGTEDYWKSPNEFITDGGGDCEDFAIAKYFTALAMEIPLGKLRITYVKAITYNRAHMVLTYYPKPDSDPLVLDNLKSEILPATQRPDLVPIYSFNVDKLWLAKQNLQDEKELGNSMGLNKWRKLIERIQKGG